MSKQIIKIKKKKSKNIKNHNRKYPVNKSLTNFIDKREKNKQSKENNPSISIITCTHMPSYIDNVFENYNRQIHEKKELIIILNNNKMNLDRWRKRANEYSNIKVFKLNENISVGSCMNFAVEQSKYDYIANFDHDDYYGSKYLNDFVKVLPYTDASLLGKRTQYVYFEKNNILALRHPNMENQYVNFIDGPTVFFKKSIFNKVKYINHDFADCALSWDCRKNRLKIYSINKDNFVYIRKSSKLQHTWKISDEELMNRFCTVIGKVENYKDYIEK